MGLFKRKKELTPTNIIEVYLPLLKEFAEKNNMELNKIDCDRHWDTKKYELELKLTINEVINPPTSANTRKTPEQISMEDNKV